MLLHHHKSLATTSAKRSSSLSSNPRAAACAYNGLARFWSILGVVVLLIGCTGGLGGRTGGVEAAADDGQLRHHGPDLEELRHPGSLVGGDGDPVADAILEQILLDQGRGGRGLDPRANPENLGRPPFEEEGEDFEMDMDNEDRNGDADSSEEEPVKKAVEVSPRGQAEQPFPPPVPHSASALTQVKRAFSQNAESDMSDTVFIAVTTVCSAAAVFGLMGAGVCWYRLHRRYRSAEEAEYGPNYGVTGPAGGKQAGLGGGVNGDGKLASSAHLYHYQHTKQQIIAMEQTGMDSKGQESEDSEGEGEEADYSVYECPGLAPTGDIEVSNPLFESSPTSHSPPATGIMTLKDEQKSPVSEE